jgi:hypothetical protein
MKDVPQAYRHESYIVRLQPNPVLEELYEDVGIHTIVLDPTGDSPPERQKDLLGDFLFLVNRTASSHGLIPGTSIPMFLSTAYLRAATSSLFGGTYLGASRDRVAIPLELQMSTEEMLRTASMANERSGITLSAALSMIREHGGSPGATSQIALALLDEHERDVVFEEITDWTRVWNHSIPHEIAESIIDKLEDLIWNNAHDVPSIDMAYHVDLAYRFSLAKLILPTDQSLRKRAADLIDYALRVPLLTSVANYSPDETSRPEPKCILEELCSRQDPTYVWPRFRVP